MDKRPKLQYIERLRVMAMVAVVLTHIGTTASTDFLENYMYTIDGVFYSSLVNLFHFAVPIFFMISGALLLNPKKELSLDKLIRNYILKYVLVLVIFGWGYAFLEEVFTYKNITISYFLNSFINMIQGKSWAHMWYMYALIGVMLCIPILRIIVKKFSEEENKYLCIISLFFLSVIPLFTKVTGVNLGVSFVMGNIYCFYMLLGYWIDNSEIRISSKVAKVIFFFMMPLLILSAYAKVMWTIDLGIAEYSSPIIVAYSVSLFIIVREKYKDNNVENKIVSLLSHVSFGVYLIHMFWINLLFKFFNINPFYPNVFIGFLLTGGFALFASVVSVLVLKKLPGLKKLI